MKRQQVVVIGAGMGGLSAAIRLASKNVAVTLVEAGDYPGGKIRGIDVADQTIDAGPTVFTMPWVFERLYQGTGQRFDEQLVLQPVDVLARHSWVGSEPLDLFADIDQSATAIEQLAGSRDAENYRRFAVRSQRIFDTLDKPFMQAQRPGPVSLALSSGLSGLARLAATDPFRTLWSSLGQQFSDPRLRQLFARYATYCGSSPFRAPATLMLIAHVERVGVWRVEGGMRALAETLARTIQALGGTIHYGRSVRRVRCGDGEQGAVQGVVLDNDEYLPCDAAIFNGDTRALSRGLLGESIRPAVREQGEQSLSAITRCQYARVHGFELEHHTVFFGEDYANEFDSIYRHARVCADPTVYVCAQDRGGRATRQTDDRTPLPRRERLFSLVNAPATHMSNAARDEAIERLDAVLRRHGLQIDDEGDARTTTPADFAGRFPATDGALYGRATHGWRGSFNRPGSRSTVPGLYLAGGSVHPGPGVPMACLSGQLAAEQLLADRT